MKKAVVALLAILSILTAGCSYEMVIRNDYTYTGENENWVCEYKKNIIVTFPEKDGMTYYQKKETNDLTATFKKDVSELSAVKHAEISYEDGFGSRGGLSEEYYDSPPRDSVYRLNGGSGTSHKLSKFYDAPENMQTALFIYADPGADAMKDHVITVTVNLDGKTQNIELFPAETSKPYSQAYERLKTRFAKMQILRLYPEWADQLNRNDY